MTVVRARIRAAVAASATAPRIGTSQRGYAARRRAGPAGLPLHSMKLHGVETRAKGRFCNSFGTALHAMKHVSADILPAHVFGRTAGLRSAHALLVATKMPAGSRRSDQREHYPSAPVPFNRAMAVVS
jgi:hypothetical protein